MSTKTNFKRVALVAVAALGLGVLTSVAPANAVASYSGGVVYDIGDAGADPAVPAVSGGIGTAATGSTICKMTAADGTTDLSLGANTTATATSDLASISIPVGGKVAILAPSTADVLVLKSMAGEAILEDTTANTVTANGTTFTAAADADIVFIKGIAVGTGTIVNIGTGTTALTSLSISVVASCSNSAWSASKSAVHVDNAWDAAPLYTDGDELTFQSGDDAYINMIGKNAYSQVLSSGTWTASATNGATVLFGDTTAIDATTTAPGSYSFLSGTYDGNGSGNNAVTVRVTPADGSVASKTDVTITYNGVTVVTKSLTFLGEATKINVIGNYTGTVGSVGLLAFTLTDDAGNQVPGSISLDATTATSRTNTLAEVNAATPLSAVTNDPDTYALGSHTYGANTFNCTTSAGTGSSTITVKHTSAYNANVVTASVTVKCAGGVDTYTVSTDKASYKIGEIATITISAKDSTGAAVSDFTTVGTGVDVTAGGGTITKAAATSDTFTNGVKTYKAQMTTAGTFNAVVNIAGTTTKSVTATYSVSGGDVAMSEVLKAIVSLIASINKQIAALQKALLKK
jgi:hypothetical protein